MFPNTLFIERDTYKIQDVVTCHSNGFPQINYSYHWHFDTGPTSFLASYHNKIYFEEISTFGIYKLTCSLLIDHNKITYHLEKRFHINLTGIYSINPIIIFNNYK